MTTTESFGRGRIAETILSSVSVPFTLNISKVPTNENQFITIDPDTNNEEIFYYTTKTGTIGEAGTLNITGRGYNVQNDTQAAGNQKEHEENGEFKLALNHIIINNKADTKTTNTFTQTQTFEGDVLFTTTDNLGLKVNQLTTVERDLITPSNGYIIYNSTDGVNQQYISGAWNDVGNTGTPDATETVAGKVEVATQAQLDAGTEFGETGAALVVKPNMVSQATESARGLVIKATDAEVLAGVEDTKYVTVEQMTSAQSTIYGLVSLSGASYQTFQTFTAIQRGMHYARFSCTKTETSGRGNFRILADGISYAFMDLGDNETAENGVTVFLDIGDTIDFQGLETGGLTDTARQNSASVTR